MISVLRETGFTIVMVAMRVHYPIQGALGGIYWLALCFSRLFYNHSTF
jgi:hypothetical protein